MIIMPNEKESMSLGGQEKVEDRGQMLEAQDEQKQVRSMAQQELAHIQRPEAPRAGMDQSY